MANTTQKPDKIDAILDGDGDVPPWQKVAQNPETEFPDLTETEIVPAISVEGQAALDWAAQKQAEKETVDRALLVDDDESTHAPTGRIYSENYDFEISELFIPRLRILSGTSQEVADGKARPGQFLIDGQTPVDKVELAILSMTRIRNLRVGEERVLMCRSHDGITGQGVPGGLCKNCAKAQWGERNPVTGRSQPPECSEGYSYQIVCLTNGALAIWDLSRTGLQAAAKINTAIKQRKYRNFVIMANTDKREGPGRSTYYVPILDTRPITREEREVVDALTLG